MNNAVPRCGTYGAPVQGPFDMDAVRAHCMSAWGIAPQPDWAAVTYGGTALRAASNIVFSNGR